ncbi:uncharacterized protein At2g27730, mitochondrial-like [Lolium rigidum]|uniref:uncharacterized protein At2g27730, mitochondrial-like n=1 Tax=Lolium rigidum TaxID=89674 RepID=UPI001F5C322B|nr:uncharacterized protein At2g27730, mitochondrial-like [Lolium rigidum]
MAMVAARSAVSRTPARSAAARFLQSRFRSGGKVLGEEEKAAETVYIKKMEQEKLQKLARKGPSTGEQAPATPSSTASDMKAGGGTGPTASTSAGVSTNKNRNYAILAGTLAGLSALGWFLLAKEPKKTGEVLD